MTVAKLAAQSDRKQFEETIAVAQLKTVIIDNVFGPITVSGSDDDEIHISADIYLNADHNRQLAILQEGVQVAVETINDTLFIYDGSPWSCKPYPRNRHCKFEWNGSDQGKYKIAYTIKLPAHLNVSAKTINDGEIKLAEVKGKVAAHNINGGVELTDVHQVVEAHTINGDLTAFFTRIPDVDGSFYALNGDINAHFPDNLVAEVLFKSLNGNFYTEFDFNDLPRKNAFTVKSDGGQTRYKLEEQQGISIGEGGPQLSFETLNGNMFVRKAKP